MTSKMNVSKIMLTVILGLIPAIIASTIFYGFHVIVHIIVAILSAIIGEYVILKLRSYDTKRFLTDYSAVLTGILLALSLPTNTPISLTMIGSLFAIIIAKQLYGGLGQNLFNPTMMGFAILMVSFPQYMTNWSIDGVISATPLDVIKTNLPQLHSISAIQSKFQLDTSSIYINLAYLIGGIFLMWRKIISWHIPVSMLGGLFLCSSFFYLINSDIYLSPLFHLIHGATMIGAFFIATDPVTASTTPKGKIIYAFSIGILTYLLRVFSGYPDGVAFAVIFINMFVPLIDQYTQPKVFGRK